MRIVGFLVAVAFSFSLQGTLPRVCDGVAIPRRLADASRRVGHFLKFEDRHEWILIDVAVDPSSDDAHRIYRVTPLETSFLSYSSVEVQLEALATGHFPLFNGGALINDGLENRWTLKWSGDSARAETLLEVPAEKVERTLAADYADGIVFWEATNNIHVQVRSARDATLGFPRTVPPTLYQRVCLRQGKLLVPKSEWTPELASPEITLGDHVFQYSGAHETVIIIAAQPLRMIPQLDAAERARAWLP